MQKHWETENSDVDMQICMSDVWTELNWTEMIEGKGKKKEKVLGWKI